MSHSPHLYTFSIHPEILSETEFLFSEFNPVQVDCCCFPVRNYWATEYSFSDPFPVLCKLQEYAYHQLLMAGFQVKKTGRTILCECRSEDDHITLPKHFFSTPGFQRVHLVMVFTKEKSMYDSGLLLRRKVPLKHPYLQHLSVEHVTKTPLYESVGVMYQEDNYVEYIGGTGIYRMICMSFDASR